MKQPSKAQLRRIDARLRRALARRIEKSGRESFSHMLDAFEAMDAEGRAQWLRSGAAVLLTCAESALDGGRPEDGEWIAQALALVRSVEQSTGLAPNSTGPYRTHTEWFEALSIRFEQYKGDAE